jgi:hypothetical protein
MEDFIYETLLLSCPLSLLLFALNMLHVAALLDYRESQSEYQTVIEGATSILARCPSLILFNFSTLALCLKSTSLPAAF